MAIPAPLPGIVAPVLPPGYRPFTTMATSLVTDITGFKCKISTCTTKFATLASLKQHESRLHSHLKERRDPQVCSNCKSNNVVQQKQRNIGKEIDKCPQCGVYWCLVASCAHEAPKQSLQKHQELLHDKEFLNKCSKCKGPKTRIAGNTRDQCTGCNAHWCLVEGCSWDSTDPTSLATHQGKFHRDIAQSVHGTLTNCKCGTAKTGNGNYAKCATCESETYWCLVDQCGLTCPSESGIKTHYNKMHK